MDCQIRIETWNSDKGDQEIHHFVQGEPNTYLFGFNRQKLGEKLYNQVRALVEDRISEIELTKAFEVFEKEGGDCG